MSEVGPNRPKRPKTGGRKKGTPNRTTGQLKDMILQALDRSGGVNYLERQAQEEPKAFLALLGRVLPMQVTGDPENPLQAAVAITFVKTDAAQPTRTT